MWILLQMVNFIKLAKDLERALEVSVSFDTIYLKMENGENKGLPT